MNRSFLWGVVIGVGGTWMYHKFMRPMKSNATR